MKKILGFFILFGFVLMVGTAGSADLSEISFAQMLLFEALGIMMVLSGTSALLHYKRYLRKSVYLPAKKRVKNTASTREKGYVHISRKEFC